MLVPLPAPSFSVENPESATVLPVELPSGDLRSLRSRGMEPVLEPATFQEDGMSSDTSWGPPPGSGLEDS